MHRNFYGKLRVFLWKYFEIMKAVEKKIITCHFAKYESAPKKYVQLFWCTSAKWWRNSGKKEEVLWNCNTKKLLQPLAPGIYCTVLAPKLQLLGFTQIVTFWHLCSVLLFQIYDPPTNTSGVLFVGCRGLVECQGGKGEVRLQLNDYHEGWPIRTVTKFLMTEVDDSGTVDPWRPLIHKIWWLQGILSHLLFGAE